MASCDISVASALACPVVSCFCVGVDHAAQYIPSPGSILSMPKFYDGTLLKKQLVLTVNYFRKSPPSLMFAMVLNRSFYFFHSSSNNFYGSLFVFSTLKWRFSFVFDLSAILSRP